MGIFSFFSKNGSKTPTLNPSDPDQPINTPVDIPEATFIETTKPNPEEKELLKVEIRQDNIQALYDFLQKDYQLMGYEDGLKNPDTSNRDSNITAILSDFDILIRRVRTFYEDAFLELDFLIESRSRLGMVDIVDELKMKRKKATDHYNKTIEMQEEANNKLGSSQRVIISYQRGFHDAMAAIAHHESSRRNF